MQKEYQIFYETRSVENLFNVVEPIKIKDSFVRIMAMTLGSLPEKISINIAFDKNQVCFLEKKECEFLFMDDKYIYWSKNKYTSGIYAKSRVLDENIFDDKLPLELPKYFNECDVLGTPVSSPLATFFSIGYSNNVVSHTGKSWRGIREDDFLKIIDTCETLLDSEPSNFRNYLNYSHLLCLL